MFEDFAGRRLFYVFGEAKPYIWTPAYEASRDGFGISMNNMYVRTMSGLVRVYGVVGSEYMQKSAGYIRLGILVHESAYLCFVYVT